MEQKATRKEVLTQVPRERVETITHSFRRDGAVEVRSEEDPPGSGTYTITAVFEE